MARARGPATASRLAEALGGGPFVVTGPEPVETSVSGNMRPARQAQRGHVALPRRPERRAVVVETWARREPTVPYSDTALVPRLFYGAKPKIRYPIVIERRTLRIKVGSRLRAFKGCALGERVAGAAEIDGLVVSVVCTDGHPGQGFALGRLEGKPLNELMIRERKRWRELYRQLDRIGSD